MEQAKEKKIFTGKIKRFLWRTAKFSLVITLSLLITLIILIQFPSFQTWVGKQASTYYSNKLKTKIKIEKVYLSFFYEVKLEGIYVEDLHKDTLLYCKSLDVHIVDFSLKKEFLEINTVYLKNSTSKIIKYKQEENFNYQFIVNYFVSKDTTPKDSSKFNILYGKLVLDNVNFTFQNINDTSLIKGFNYSNIKITDLHASLKDFVFEKDTLHFKVENLTMKEKCGFELKELNALIKIAQDEIRFDSLKLVTSNSYLHGSVAFTQEINNNFSDFVNKVAMNITLKDTSKVSATDISYFVPQIIGLKEVINLEGKIRGTVNNLSGTKMKIKFGKKTEFVGDFKIVDITEPEQFYLHFNIKQLTTNRNDLEKIQIPPYNNINYIQLPQNFSKLGTINYKGTIDGFLSDIAAKGTLKTAIGILSTDIGVSNIGVKNKLLAYHGKIQTKLLNIGNFLQIPNLGTITASIQIEGEGTQLNNLNAKISGDISQIDYNKYNYAKLKLDGAFNNKKFIGTVDLKDPNADLNFNGIVNFNDKLPDLDFITTINHFDLKKLHLITGSDSVNNLTSQIAINLKGSNLDNLSGRINFDNTNYQVNEKNYNLNSFDLKLDQETPDKIIKLTSSVLDLKIEGSYKASNLLACINKYIDKYYPTTSKQSINKKEVQYVDKFNYKIKIKKLGIINGLIAPDLMIAPGTTVEGNFDAVVNELSLNGHTDYINYKTYELKNWDIKANSLANSIEINTTIDKAWMSDSLFLLNLKLNTKSYNYKSDFKLNWDNKSVRKNSGDWEGNIIFSKKDLDLHFSKMQVYIADSLWILNDSTDHITFDTTGKINFRMVHLKNMNQEINLGGSISKNPIDKLTFEFKDFKLDQLNPLITSSELKLKGLLTGNANLIDFYNKTIFTSDFNFADLFINQKKLGNGEVKNTYNSSKDIVTLDGFFSNGMAGFINGKKENNIEFTGYYYPGQKEDNINLNLKLKAIDITLFQPYLKGILTFSKGLIDGNASIKGSTAKPIITGKLNLVDITNMRIDYLNTFYRVTGSISIFPNRIQFGSDSTGNTDTQNPIRLYDLENHEATMWGNIFHDNFKVSKLDFDLSTKNFLVLNTSGANNPLYFGKAFVTGNIGLYGNLDYMNLDINVKTEKKTQFNIPLSGPATVAENNYVIFVKSDTVPDNFENLKNDLSGINMNFNLDVTPDAEVQLIFDSKAGDVIKARGDGDISLNINTNGKFEMRGLYTLTDGNYLFSLENFISKKFDIESGSTIKWTGDPLDADINISASYRQRASLSPFFPSDSTRSYAKRVPVNCMLLMRNKLLNPDISFGIQLPTAAEITRQTVMNYINNEQELNRQVFSLLLLKSFVSPLQLSNNATNGDGKVAAAATSSEMLSNQLSNWLSALSTNIDIAVNYQPGSAMSNEQLDLALSKQLFNDRLTIDGNVGVNNGANQKTSNMIGDLVVDYKIYPDGKLRVKGFNKSNDNTQITTQGGPFTQGVGIFYREEFNTVDELYKRYLWWLSKRKKNAAITN